VLFEQQVRVVSNAVRLLAVAAGQENEAVRLLAQEMKMDRPSTARRRRVKGGAAPTLGWDS
jgi:hypothetical protein